MREREAAKRVIRVRERETRKLEQYLYLGFLIFFNIIYVYRSSSGRVCIIPAPDPNPLQVGFLKSKPALFTLRLGKTHPIRIGPGQVKSGNFCHS